MNDARQAALERLRKLLRMTRANGCTEAEALAAAERAARLMAELGVTIGDLDFEEREIAVRGGWASARSKLWLTIAAYTNTACILGDRRLDYVGREPWPEVARYLHQVTDRAINQALREFQGEKWFQKRSSLRAKRAATHDFTEAMVARLKFKLRDLYAPTYSAEAGRAAQAELERRHPNTKTVAVTTRRPNLGRYDEAMVRGLAAGEQVTLSHGMPTGATSRQIGGAK